MRVCILTLTHAHLYIINVYLFSLVSCAKGSTPDPRSPLGMCLLHLVFAFLKYILETMSYQFMEVFFFFLMAA